MAGKKRSSGASATTMSPNSTHKSLPPGSPPVQHAYPAAPPALMQPKSIAKPPKKIGYWKSWVYYYEGNFAGSMLETWEKVLIHTFLFVLVLLFYIAVSTYLPERLSLLGKRIHWYIYGDSAAPLV